MKQKPVILLLLCLSIMVASIAQTSESREDIRYWSKELPLKFSDFKGQPGKEDTTLRNITPELLTHKMGSIMTTIHVNFESNQGKTVFVIQAGMDRNTSWIKDAGDTISLKHEQAHFDITEIHARKLRKEIQKAKSITEAKEIYDKITRDEEEEQAKFDKENNYQKGGVTKEWKKKIQDELHELEKFTTIKLTLSIGR